MPAPSAFKRYNQVQKALSAHAKESGYSFKGTGRNFSQIASQVYNDKSGRDIDTILEGVYKGTDPIMPPSFFECFEYYFFDGEARDKLGKFDKEFMQDNLVIVSPQILGYEIPANQLSYENDFEDFSTYCNTNKGIWWHDYDDVPMVRFTEPTWDGKGNRWVSTLEPCDEEAYGYIPGIGATETDWIPPEELPEAPPEPEPVPKEDIIEAKKIEAHKRTAKIKTIELKIKKAEAKLETQKAKRQKGALKLLKRYEKYYKQGILTKADFKKKIMDLEL